MTNRLEEAINCNDGDQAAKIIHDALGMESNDVANYCFPQTWPAEREQRAALLANGCKPRRAFSPHRAWRGQLDGRAGSGSSMA
jgi:hypothetical protein